MKEARPAWIAQEEERDRLTETAPAEERASDSPPDPAR